jgi:hypothetical protein
MASSMMSNSRMQAVSATLGAVAPDRLPAATCRCHD